MCTNGDQETTLVLTKGLITHEWRCVEGRSCWGNRWHGDFLGAFLTGGHLSLSLNTSLLDIMDIYVGKTGEGGRIDEDDGSFPPAASSGK